MTNAPRTIPGATAHIAVPAALTAPPPPGPTPLREPGNAAIGAPKPGTERLGLAANGGRAGAMGVHPSQLAGFGLEDTIESVLATTVRIAQPHVMLARLSGLVAEIGSRSSIDRIVYRLQDYSGRTMSLGKAVQLVCAADEAAFGDICCREPLAIQIATVAALLDDDTAALQGATKVAALETQPGDAAALRDLLARDPGEGLDAIRAQAPHNPELLADVLRLEKSAASPWEIAHTVEAFGAAAVPAWVKQLESSGDLRAACRGLSKVGRLATGAVDPLWRALEQRRGIAGKDASKDRAAIMEALATIGGDRLVSMPNAVDVIKESYVADREHDHDGAAVRVMAAMGDAAFLDLVSDKNALADIINGMGPAAWTHLPAVLAKRDGDFWWRIMNRVGPPPAPAILELVRIARDGGSAQPLIEPLKDAAAHGMTARAREQVIPLMREQISGGDGRSASLAYDALLKLLSGAEHEALVLEGIRGTQFRRHAILAIQGAEGALSTEPVMSALSGLLADPGTDLWCRMRIRETLNHPAAEIAQESLEHLLTATTFESSDVYEVARAFGDRMHLATLARLLDAESPGVRLKAAEIMVRRVEHKPVVADAIEPLIKLFTVVDADAELAAVREYPYEKVRGALDEAKA